MGWAMAVVSVQVGDVDSDLAEAGAVATVGVRGVDPPGAHLRTLQLDLPGLRRPLRGEIHGAPLKSAAKKSLSTFEGRLLR